MVRCSLLSLFRATDVQGGLRDLGSDRAGSSVNAEEVQLEYVCTYQHYVPSSQNDRSVQLQQFELYNSSVLLHLWLLVTHNQGY
jgi:hypothetical protein